MMALIMSPVGRWFIGALTAAALALGLLFWADGRGYDRAALEYTLKIERIHAEYKDASDKEAVRQAAANSAAKAREAARIAAMQAQNQSLQEQIEELEREASQDPDAGKLVLGASSVRRIDQVR